jgi:hypothetical protein
LNRSEEKKNESEGSLEKSERSVDKSVRYRSIIRKRRPSIIISENSSHLNKESEDLEIQFIE